MQWEARFKEAFLCCDTRKSLGLVLNREQQKAVPEMNLDAFIQYGMKLLKELPADQGLKNLFEAIMNPNTKTVSSNELCEIMGLMKNRTPEQLQELLNALDPDNKGSFNYQAFVDVFSK